MKKTKEILSSTLNPLPNSGKKILQIMGPKEALLALYEDLFLKFTHSESDENLLNAGTISKENFLDVVDEIFSSKFESNSTKL